MHSGYWLLFLLIIHQRFFTAEKLMTTTKRLRPITASSSIHIPQRPFMHNSSHLNDRNNINGFYTNFFCPYYFLWMLQVQVLLLLISKVSSGIFFMARYPSHKREECPRFLNAQKSVWIKGPFTRLCCVRRSAVECFFCYAGQLKTWTEFLSFLWNIERRRHFIMVVKW